MTTEFILPLNDPRATLAVVGGKGASLARLANAGLPVPAGFHITTAAYRQFVAENDLQPAILVALMGADAAQPSTLEAASRAIEDLFGRAEMPPEIAEAIAAAYAALDGGSSAVAIRSSATAEDLPELSFAGQQETYLNLCGATAVQAAVKKCWASLWTARAIGYRAQHDVDQNSVALAVVVQILVEAGASGILFTANPINGERDQAMITATWGLGEAIVGGQVTPDTIVVAQPAGSVLSRETADKQVMTVRVEGGTAEKPVPDSLRHTPVLSDGQAAELAQYGRQIEALYGLPMDIEWALAKGRFAILQARPITALPEPPLQWLRSSPRALLARGSFGEFVPDPVSPLFATLAVPLAKQATCKLLGDMIGMSGDNSYLYEVINGYVYVGFEMRPSIMWSMTVGTLILTPKILKTSHKRWVAGRDQLLQAARKWDRDLATLTAPELLQGAREIFGATAEYYAVAQSGPIPVALMSEITLDRFYRALVKRKSDPDTPTFLLGFESVPLRAEKSLFDLAQWVKGQPALAEYMARTCAAVIVAAVQSDPPPAPLAGEFSARLACHQAEFGHTLYDLDFAKPIPAHDPLPLIEALQAYLSGQAQDPHERQQAQAERREQAAQAIARRLDPVRRGWFLKLLKWAQDCAPEREDCIADMGLGYPQLRRLLGELGRRLVARGALASAADVYWLEEAELDGMAVGLGQAEPLPSCVDKVVRRKAQWRRARSVTPPFTLPEKSFIQKLMVHDNPTGDTLKGYGASGGKVTAPACVLYGPEDFGKMRPGDVLVAVTTTPAWTPLFAMAAAVVTDIGGPLSHSSIVAREYGIPAVMATGVASRRIRDGQTITVDGGAGIVTLSKNGHGGTRPQ